MVKINSLQTALDFMCGQISGETELGGNVGPVFMLRQILDRGSPKTVFYTFQSSELPSEPTHNFHFKNKEDLTQFIKYFYELEISFFFDVHLSARPLPEGIEFLAKISSSDQIAQELVKLSIDSGPLKKFESNHSL